MPIYFTSDNQFGFKQNSRNNKKKKKYHKQQNSRNDNRKINMSKHDTKLLCAVRLVIVIKCASEISLAQAF